MSGNAKIRKRAVTTGLCLMLAVAALGLAACGGTSATKTVTESETVPAPAAQTTSTPATTATPASASSEAPQRHVFHGSGQQDLGTITVPADTIISWNCPNCGGTNFIINNAQSDANGVPTNGLDQTHGVDTLPAGVYHTVVVDTTGGPWTVEVGGTAPAPSGSDISKSPVPTQPSVPTQAQPTAPQSSVTHCDPNISVYGGECRFAENTFYEYWTHDGATSFSVYSPSDGSSFNVACSAGSMITCTADQGTTVEFSQNAIDDYTQSAADSYASSHDLGQ